MGSGNVIDKRHYSLLYGGTSAEREVSLLSGAFIAKELESLGHVVECFDIVENPVAALTSRAIHPCVIALHGGIGEDGRLQSLLELMNIPYSGSRPLACAMAMHKPTAKRMFAAAGIPTPRWHELQSKSDAIYLRERFAGPVVAKPVAEGSSVGVRLLDLGGNADGLIELAALQSSFGRLLVEEYIRGIILTVAIIDVPGCRRALAPLEIIPTHSLLYDAKAKYDGLRRYNHFPALTTDESNDIATLAIHAHEVLGCSGITRVDVIYSNSDGPFVLEVNTIPGLGPSGNFRASCSQQGISDAMLANYIIGSIS